ncbi:MAG: hypothetical protein GEU81_12235 [Nitriliruptorales bacterium]|nr:hypothetical protein [Nitriliruptorales bacterium]
MHPVTHRPRWLVAFALVAALTLLASACTGDDGAAEDSGEAAVEDDQERAASDAGYDGEVRALGAEDPGIPEEFPEMVPTTSWPVAEPDHLVAVEYLGPGQGAAHLVDLDEGQLGYVSVGLTDVYMLSGGGEDAPTIVAAGEQFRPRGARGQAVAVTTFWDGNGEVSGEVILPRVQYRRQFNPSEAMSSDGRYVYLIDTILNGIVAVDVIEQEMAGELAIPGCSVRNIAAVGPDTFYLPCWSSGEVIEVTVSGDGLEIADRVQAFEEGTQMLDYTFFAAESRTILLFTRFSEAITLDLAGGLPEEVADPVDVMVKGETIVDYDSRLSPDGTRALVAYAEGEDYTEYVETYRVYDTGTWELAGEFAAPEDGIEDLLYSRDGSELYVLQNEVTVTDEEGDEDEVSRILTLDPESGEVLADVELELTSGDDFDAIYLTTVVEDEE